MAMMMAIMIFVMIVMAMVMVMDLPRTKDPRPIDLAQLREMAKDVSQHCLRTAQPPRSSCAELIFHALTEQ
jgi:hypothetical protein